MDTIESDAPSLLDLLGRRWETGSPIVATVFSCSSESVAFLSVDGKVWQTATADSESPMRRYRVAADTGRPTISPRRKPIRPLSPSVFDDEVLSLAAFSDNGFALGARSGRVMTMSAAGRLSVLGKAAQSIEALDSTPQGRDLFAASGGIITRYQANGTSARVLAEGLGPVAALATTHDAKSVAWLDEGGLHIQRTEAEQPIEAHVSITIDNGIGALAWSPCGHWLAAAAAQKELTLLNVDGRHVERTLRLSDYPGNVSSLSWDIAGDFLATSGAFRIVAWDVGLLRKDPTATPRTNPTGRAGCLIVSTVACHPQKPVIAVGYENGAVVVAQAGQADELVLRISGPGHIATMCWSNDGNHLAFGTSEGEAVVATFPLPFFK